MVQVSESRIAAASPDVIFNLLKNSATWPLWSMIGEYELVKPGAAGPHELGAQRYFRTGRLVMHEEIVEIVPDRKISYTLLSGFPLLDYRADTILEPLAGAGTKVTWQSSFRPKYRGTGWFWKIAMAYTYRRILRDLSRTVADPARVAEIMSASQGEHGLIGGVPVSA